MIRLTSLPSYEIISIKSGRLTMKVLVIGSGGREHTLCWKISQSPLLKELICAPGNAGISSLARTVDIKPTALPELIDFAEKNKIDLTVVGPELPLTFGIVDAFQERGLKIFGASKENARLEGSKIFAKKFMERRGIPTASFKTFDVFDQALSFIQDEKTRFPIVVKADGLAAGKGAIICQVRKDAESALQSMMVDKTLNEAGEKVVIEDCLEGREVSFLVLSDGKSFLPLVTSQDYKRAQDNDEGLNTGGMGSYSPSAHLDEKNHNRIIEEIVRSTIAGMAEEGKEFRGVLYVGAMLTQEGPKVLEFNVRFGDPETQVILPRMESDLIPLLEACSAGSLSGMTIEWSPRASVCIVAASGGYPESYEKRKEIEGLDLIEEGDDLQVFHAGTAFDSEGKYITSGGRVLGVNALGRDIKDARNRAYEALGMIRFDKMHYRKDIALDAC